jgi:hypothetical protein
MFKKKNDSLEEKEQRRVKIASKMQIRNAESKSLVRTYGTRQHIKYVACCNCNTTLTLSGHRVGTVSRVVVILKERVSHQLGISFVCTA